MKTFEIEETRHRGAYAYQRLCECSRQQSSIDLLRFKMFARYGLTASCTRAGKWLLGLIFGDLPLRVTTKRVARDQSEGPVQANPRHRSCFSRTMGSHDSRDVLSMPQLSIALSVFFALSFWFVVPDFESDRPLLVKYVSPTCGPCKVCGRFVLDDAPMSVIVVLLLVSVLLVSLVLLQFLFRRGCYLSYRFDALGPLLRMKLGSEHEHRACREWFKGTAVWQRGVRSAVVARHAPAHGVFYVLTSLWPNGGPVCPRV